MLTACFIIIAWVVKMPLWASITITVFAAIKCLISTVAFGLNIAQN